MVFHEKTLWCFHEKIQENVNLACHLCFSCHSIDKPIARNGSQHKTVVFVSNFLPNNLCFWQTTTTIILIDLKPFGPVHPYPNFRLPLPITLFFAFLQFWSSSFIYTILFLLFSNLSKNPNKHRKKKKREKKRKLNYKTIKLPSRFRLEKRCFS